MWPLIVLLVIIVWNVVGFLVAVLFVNYGVIDTEKPHWQWKLFFTSPLAWLLENTDLGPPWN